MQFFSINFLIFFTAVVLAYYVTPGKYRWGIMLLASYYFYMSWEPAYALILALSTAIDYFCARSIGKAKKTSDRRHYFLLSLITNFGLLLAFKYLTPLNAILKALLQSIHITYHVPFLDLIAPLGISFFIFKKLSYMIDVYRQNQEPEMHIGKFALYVSFFPEITAGPIDRAHSLLPQFDTLSTFDYSRITGGLKLMVWGLFKKIVIADRLAIFVNMVYDHPQNYQGPSLLLAVLFFSIQIYADFSGYTDMAIGMSQILGYKLMDNFNRPYFATSISEFWKRWHISLTTWFRDYLFLPVAFAISRKIKKDRLFKIKAEVWAYVVGISVTMLLCGLWHGAGWTFVVWGGLHGLYLILSLLTRKARGKWRKKIIGERPTLKAVYQGMRILFTFSVVSYIWIFFRANSLSDAFYIASHLLVTGGSHGNAFIGMEVELIIALAVVGMMILMHILQPHEGIRNMFAKKAAPFRWFLYALLALAIMNLGKFNEVPFIYFQF
jgi:D-alanyl-lipoteichoic acid acyltransferase DltB (MBOAT superfamily)